MGIDSLYHMNELQEKMRQEAVEKTMKLKRIESYRNSIRSIISHPNSPGKQEILDDVERDIDEMYRTEQITMEQKQGLNALLDGNTTSTKLHK